MYFIQAWREDLPGALNPPLLHIGTLASLPRSNVPRISIVHASL